MDCILKSTHGIQEQRVEMKTNRRRVSEEDSILLLGVAKDQQHHIQNNIRIDTSKSRTNSKREQFHTIRNKNQI